MGRRRSQWNCPPVLLRLQTSTAAWKVLSTIHPPRRGCGPAPSGSAVTACVRETPAHVHQQPCTGTFTREASNDPKLKQGKRSSYCLSRVKISQWMVVHPHSGKCALTKVNKVQPSKHSDTDGCRTGRGRGLEAQNTSAILVILMRSPKRAGLADAQTEA